MSDMPTQETPVSRVVTPGESARATLAQSRIVYTGVLDDGQEMFVERFIDDDGNETGVWAAFRERPDTSLVWGPPVRLERKT